jgi:uncharacterized protein YcaQ
VVVATETHLLSPGTAGRGRYVGSYDRAPSQERVDPAATGRPFAGRTALLSPFDRLIHDRRRALELFHFDYHLEMYVPKAKRRWGYFALPVLHHDRLIGKVDATADRWNSILQVHAIHQDIRFTPAVAEAVRAELEALASWLGLATVSTA